LLPPHNAAAPELKPRRSRRGEHQASGHPTARSRENRGGFLRPHAPHSDPRGSSDPFGRRPLHRRCLRSREPTYGSAGGRRGGGAGGAERPSPDLQLARRIPASGGVRPGRGGGDRAEGRGDRGGGSLTVRRLFMAARREGERGRDRRAGGEESGGRGTDGGGTGEGVAVAPQRML
jgi:hypothetical protein